VVRCEYLRKFAFDKMIEFGASESVADFIEGRTPKTIGVKHYMILLRQAKQYYSRYAEYIRQLGEKVTLLTA
jgi:intergrase/recombinase